MQARRGDPREERAHRQIAVILRGGLVLASILLVAGVAAHTAVGEHDAPAVSLFTLFDEDDLGTLLCGVGITVLALTPLVRAIALVWVWGRHGDRKYAVIASVVVGLLALSATLGRG